MMLRRVTSVLLLPGLLIQIGAPAWAGVAELTLRQKLEAQWARYREASRVLAQKVGREKELISRAQWEQLLTVSDAQARLSPADLAALIKEQEGRIAQARAKAYAESQVIDLGQVRKHGRAAELCRSTPKGGMLHLHGWGTVDRETARQIVTEGDPIVDLAAIEKEMAGETWKEHRLYPSDWSFLSAAAGSFAPRRYSELSPTEKEGVLNWLFMDAGKYNPKDADIFRRFMGSFVAMGTLFFRGKGNPETRMWDALFRRAATQGINYLEVTQNLNGATADKMAGKVKDFERIATEAYERYGVTLKIITQFDRSAKVEDNRQKVATTLQVPPSPVVVGVNLVANEERFPALEGGQTVYGQLLAAQQEGKTRLRSTIHAGELGDARNLRDAIVFGVERIGHGVRFEMDPVALEYARGDATSGRPPIGIEINLQSNQRLGAVDDLRTHPFLRQLRQGIPVSLSTDDEGIFVTDANLECQTAIESSDITWVELKRVFLNSIETSFASPAEKAALAAQLRVRLENFEKAWQ